VQSLLKLAQEASVAQVVDWAFKPAYRFSFRRSTHTMSVMCSLAACKAQTGMCGHEKAMLSIAVLAAIGLGAYFLVG
jgi:hypothetical protein